MGLRGGWIMAHYAHIGIIVQSSAFSFQTEACSELKPKEVNVTPRAGSPWAVVDVTRMGRFEAGTAVLAASELTHRVKVTLILGR